MGAGDVIRLLESPTALLPPSVRVAYDPKAGGYAAPGIRRLLEPPAAAGVAGTAAAADQWAGFAGIDPRKARLEALWAGPSAFGPQAKTPPQRERRLSAADFGLFAACGALGCTVTHMAVVPLDVVKTRLQTSPGRYAGLAEGVATIAREEGWTMLLRGSGPTLLGYLWYGLTVYPGYELFKRLFKELAGPALATEYRVPLVLLAGASATVIACVGVCPCEAVRIRQVADPDVGGFAAATRRIAAESGWGKLYEGFAPILFRQVSFGMMKFLVFDFFAEFIYRLYPVLAERTSTELAVSLISGLVAGVASAIVSQPADTVFSTMNRKGGRASIGGTAAEIVADYGFRGLFLGLSSRIVWSGAIISGQASFFGLHAFLLIWGFRRIARCLAWLKIRSKGFRTVKFYFRLELTSLKSIVLSFFPSDMKPSIPSFGPFAPDAVLPLRLDQVGVARVRRRSASIPRRA
ncbi:unnamed protein product, partial [Phaeothamnion confervicola]